MTQEQDPASPNNPDSITPIDARLEELGDEARRLELNLANQSSSLVTGMLSRRIDAIHAEQEELRQQQG